MCHLHNTPRTINLAHSWRFVPQTDAQGLKKKQCSLGDLPSVWENCISHTHLSVYHVHSTVDGTPASSLRLHLVIGTRFVHQAPNSMMPYGRPCNHACCACAHLEYSAVVWIAAGWHTSCILNKIINAPCGTLKLLLALGVAKYIKSYKIHFVQYATDYCPLEHDNYKTISAHLGSPISC